MFRRCVSLAPPAVISATRTAASSAARGPLRRRPALGLASRGVPVRCKAAVAPRGFSALSSSAGPSSTAPSPSDGVAAHESLRDVIRDLQSRLEGSSAALVTDIASIAQNGVGLSATAPLPDVADFAQSLVQFRQRLPLRELMPIVAERLKSENAGPEALPSVIRLLNYAGQGSLYFADLFEFCQEHLHSLKSSELALFVYEAGRHGLRGRHFIDAASSRAAELAPQMGLTDVMNASQGMVRFSRDWQKFFIQARPYMMTQVHSMNNAQLLLALRVARSLKSLPGFVDLHAACCTELMLKIGSLTLQDCAQALMVCNYDSKYLPQAQGLVRCIEQDWSKRDDLSGLRVAEAIDALECFATWKMVRSKTVADRLQDILIERQTELKYAGNVSLWVTATDALAKMECLDAAWPLVVLDLCRDSMFLHRTSFYLTSTVIVALGRLRVFDELAYKNIADYIVSDFDLFRDVGDLGPVLWSFAMAGYFHEGLFNAAYDKMLEWFEAESLNMSRKATQACLLQVVWCFVVSGHHKRYESFAAFLDYAFFGELLEARPLNVRRLAEIADVALVEAPTIAALSQFASRMDAVRKDPQVRRHLGSTGQSEVRLAQEMRAALQELGYPFAAAVWPDEASAFPIDLSLEPKTGQKVGLLAAGRFQMFRAGVPSEPVRLVECGHLIVARRVHVCHGWRTVPITWDMWSAVGGGLEERRKFFDDVLRSLLA